MEIVGLTSVRINIEITAILAVNTRCCFVFDTVTGIGLTVGKNNHIGDLQLIASRKVIDDFRCKHKSII